MYVCVRAEKTSITFQKSWSYHIFFFASVEFEYLVGFIAVGTMAWVSIACNKNPFNQLEFRNTQYCLGFRLYSHIGCRCRMPTPLRHLKFRFIRNHVSFCVEKWSCMKPTHTHTDTFSMQLNVSVYSVTKPTGKSRCGYHKRTYPQ